MTKPRILVHGAGLIGVYVGGRLAAAGADVTLLGRPHVLDDIRANGLKLTSWDGYERLLTQDALPRLTDDPAALRDADLILLTVKSQATAPAAVEIAARALPDTPVLSLQNGVSNVDTLRASLPDRTVLAGMVPFNVAQRGPGHFHQGTEGMLSAQADPALNSAIEAFVAAGLPLDLHADMNAVLWGKLIVNLNNAINALSGVPLVRQLAQRDFRRCVALSQIEALRLLRQAGIRPAKVMRLPTWAMPYILGLPDKLYFRIAARGGVRIDPHARSSMADDLTQGRTTEIDYLNGEVVRLAERLGDRAPINSRIVEHIHAAERGAQAWKASDLYRDLLSAASAA